MVPNDPLMFTGDGRKLTEDAIAAFSWEKFLTTGDETWPLRLPMTKSVVRAMDTVTSFCASSAGGGLSVDNFVVGGASKRGWTAWTTAAVDNRVVAIIPVVLDLLNLEASFDHHYRSYGFWAPAIAEFERGRYHALGPHAAVRGTDRHRRPLFISGSADDAQVHRQRCR